MFGRKRIAVSKNEMNGGPMLHSSGLLYWIREGELVSATRSGRVENVTDAAGDFAGLAIHGDRAFSIRDGTLVEIHLRSGTIRELVDVGPCVVCAAGSGGIVFQSRDTIRACDLDGGRVRTIADPHRDGFELLQEVVVDESHVYWSACRKLMRAPLDDGRLEVGGAYREGTQAPLDGGRFEVLSNAARPVALALADNSLFATEWEPGGRVLRFDKRVNSLVEVAREADAPRFVTVVRDRVFWTSCDKASNRGSLRAVATAGGRSHIVCDFDGEPRDLTGDDHALFVRVIRGEVPVGYSSDIVRVAIPER